LLSETGTALARPTAPAAALSTLRQNAASSSGWNPLCRPVTAHASWNTAPEIAARYIQKQQCFCFTNQTFAAGETREMPVVFRVSRDVPRDIGTISLSYTFFEAPKAPA